MSWKKHLNCINVKSQIICVTSESAQENPSFSEPFNSALFNMMNVFTIY